MKLLFSLLLLACLLSVAPDSGPTSAPPAPSPASAPERVSFVPLHVFIDPGGKPLAAYQIEIVATAGDATLVGIEGGDDPAYSDAPYYDKRAMRKQRIIIAAFNTGSALPTAPTRVATLMFRVAGTAEPHYAATLQVAASSDGKPIPATVTLSPTKPVGASPIAAKMEGAAR
ncbi:MAG TPA: hypothetical protein VG269_14690 [Tepidisphaeraceae bacterium]|jgi:hypothetical protein|nr:hypothetical protein [Tepidisphaeraceae bacterium]